MGNNIVNSAVCLVKPFCPSRHFVGGGLFFTPPVALLKAHILVGAFSAAKGKKAVALYFKNLTSHKVDKVSLNSVHHSSVPIGYTASVYGLHIVVSAVHKSGNKTAGCQIVNYLLFCFISVPYISEISAYYKHVAAFKLSEATVIQPFKASVHIACYVYRDFHPLFN